MVVLYKIGAFLKKNWIRMLVAFAIGLIFMTIYNASYASTGVNSWRQLEYYRDGSFISFMIIVSLSLLTLISQTGFFDIFSFYPSRKKKEDGTKENYSEYVQRRNEERGKINLSFLSYIIIALVYAIFSLVLYFMLK